MGCNCGKKTASAQRWIYTSPKGEKKVYTSETQARAAQIRNSGGSYVVVPA